MGQIQFMQGLALFAVFSLALVAFAIGFAQDNSAPVSLANDTNFVYLQDNYETNQEIFLEEGKSSAELLPQLTVQEGGGTELTGGTFSVGIKGLTSTVANTSKTAYRTIFGSDRNFAFIFTIFGSLLALIGFLYVWKTLRGGIPD